MVVLYSVQQSQQKAMTLELLKLKEQYAINEECIRLSL